MKSRPKIPTDLEKMNDSRVTMFFHINITISHRNSESEVADTSYTKPKCAVTDISGSYGRNS